MRKLFKQLVFAREYRGYTQTELSKEIHGLSQSNLSKFEKGISSLSEDLINRILDFLNFPKSFIELDIDNSLENVHFRKRSAISKKKVVELERRIKIVGYLVDQMSDAIEWPEVKLQSINLDEGYSIENVARFTRKLLGLRPDEPVRDVFRLVEGAGVITVEIDAFEKFDGVSFLTDGGVPVIIINKGFTNDRKRFTIAHELGHLVLHVFGNFIISDSRDREKEANDFAAEFLMPKDVVFNHFTSLKLSDLHGHKMYWLTSMASIVYRAKEIGCISSSKTQSLYVEMSRRGMRRNEGNDVCIDQPSHFQIAYKLHKNELLYTDTDLSNAFHLPLDIIMDFCNTETSRLRIVR